MAGFRISKQKLEEYKNNVDFETLFTLTLKQVETLFYIMSQQRQKRLAGGNYGITSMHKIRVLANNIKHLLILFRWQCKAWEKMTQQKRAKLREQGIELPNNIKKGKEKKRALEMLHKGTIRDG